MKWKWLPVAVSLLWVGGCASSTAHIPAVSGFNPEKYLGTWYEIARLPHSFEDGLSQVRAEYTLDPDNESITVRNRGFNATRQKWSEATGTAVFARSRDIGLLEVSFFRPFWGEYKIIVLDPDYRYVMVTSSRMNYLWILCRTPQMEAQRLKELIAKAAAWGFNTDSLIIVEQ